MERNENNKKWLGTERSNQRFNELTPTYNKVNLRSFLKNSTSLDHKSTEGKLLDKSRQGNYQKMNHNKIFQTKLKYIVSLLNSEVIEDEKQGLAEISKLELSNDLIDYLQQLNIISSFLKIFNQSSPQKLKINTLILLSNYCLSFFI